MQRLVTIFVALSLARSLAFAQASNEQAAQEEFTRGNTAYNLGKFNEAVAYFTKAYEAWPRPEFLYNIAQSYRLAGNCKQALYFYKRFRSLKENDLNEPLSKKKKQEVDQFIAQLTECAAKADSSAATPPDTIDRPVSTTTPTTPTTPVKPPPSATATTKTKTAAPKTTAGRGDKEADDQEAREEGDSSLRATTGARKLVSVRFVGGVAKLSSGKLGIPVQPSFGVVGGYPLPVGRIVLEFGAGVAYTPLPYLVMNEQKRGTMLAARATVAARYAVHPKVALRGELGVGVVSLSGLEMGNPLTTERDARSFTLPSVRVGVAADIAITPNISATVSPLGIGFSPASDGLYGGSLREIDLLVGIAYQ